ncbi:MAG: carbohydrate binding domain-containing protein [Acidobacteriaceae bacterium]
MRIRLQSKPAKLLALAVTVLLLTTYCVIANSRYRAARVAAKGDRTSLERAIALQPNDADFRERLARILLFSDQDAAGALRNYKIATGMNPYSSASWLGLAQSQLILGNQAASLQATEHAVDVDPTTPSVAWEAANLFVTNGRTEPALREIRFVLANDPSMLFQGLQLVHRLEPSAPKAVQIGVPRNATIYLAFITMLAQQNQLDDAKAVWPLLMQLHQSFDPKLSFFFLQSLINSGQAETALRYWNEMAKELPEIKRLNDAGNLIHNPGFEYDTLNGGFDWLYAGSQEVDLRNETSDAHEGRRSLLITFLGQRTSDVGMHQYVELEPNTRYRFRAFMKSDLQTANGLEFMLIDLSTQKHLFETNDSVDDRQWKEFSAEFVTGPKTQLGVLLMARTGGTLVSGNALVDDLRLEKVRP